LIPRLVDTQVATLTAVDYDGKRRNLGGDPVIIKLIGPLDDTQQEMAPNNLGHLHQDNNTSDDGVRIVDHKNGQYTIRLRLSNCGRYIKIGIFKKKHFINLTSVFMYFRYKLLVYVLGRPVACNGNTGHIDFSIVKSIDPICQYSRGPSMQQPVAIAVDHNSARVRCQKMM